MLVFPSPFQTVPLETYFCVWKSILHQLYPVAGSGNPECHTLDVDPSTADSTNQPPYVEYALTGHCRPLQLLIRLTAMGRTVASPTNPGRHLHCDSAAEAMADVLLLDGQTEHAPTAPFFEYVPYPHSAQTPALM
jgi:hypothetical protein